MKKKGIPFRNNIRKYGIRNEAVREISYNLEKNNIWRIEDHPFPQIKAWKSMARIGLCADSLLISGERVELSFLFYNVKN